MSDTAIITYTNLTSTQALTVKELQEAINVFNAADILSKEKHWNVVTKFIELQMEFPELASLARGYYEAVAAPLVEPQFEGKDEALFWLFLTLRSFAALTKLEDFHSMKPFLSQYLSELNEFID